MRRRVFADFSIAHVMRFRNDKATGEITLSQAMLSHPRECQTQGLCKRNVLAHLTENHTFTLPQVLFVGDGENDICLFQAAHHSFAFQPKTASVRAAAQYVLDHNLADLLHHLPPGDPVHVTSTHLEVTGT